ncbi:HD-GYP domain-containing protein [Carboxydochorda subterranea]|uniref:HD-GYP domain-containing protein n=1 Tax=Carboxydichorda subterranea TaxID=3109565 RepID=A0ABZ1BT93_9FIRM|nr:HD-GYP domain-containing protein [Limnochorda sp. L945t]WRP16045.1 HD-GYP domain-containing protein [Limnochorda sp. L945t]
MLMLSLETVQAGMVLATDVDLEGRALLRAGATLSPYHLRRLGELGIRTLYVYPSAGAALHRNACPRLLSEETKRAAFRVVRRQLQRLERGLTIQSRPVFPVVWAILKDALEHPGVLGELEAVRAAQDVLFAHSVSVAATAIFLGIHSGWDRADLKALGVGALLHDAGKARLSQSVWTKPGKLTEEEYRYVQEHTRLGFEAIRRQGAFDVRSAHIAWEHHERWDGTGYPRGLVREAIHPFARLVAVVDVFDALTSDRPYRPAWRRDRAIAWIAERAGTAFDPVMVRRFLARVAPYPVGCWVRLNTGEVARVVRLTPGLPARPVVELGDGTGAMIDLGTDMSRRIVGPVESQGAVGDESRG